DDGAGAGVEDVLDRGDRSANAPVVGNSASRVERYIKIDTDQHAFPAKILQIGKRLLGHGTSLLSDPSDAYNKVGGPATIAPLVVVPAQYLHHRSLPLGKHQCGLRVKDAAMRIIDNVRRNDGVLGIFQDPFERPARLVFERLIDLLDRYLLLQLRRQVGNAAVGHRDTQSDTVQFAVQ